MFELITNLYCVFACNSLWLICVSVVLRLARSVGRERASAYDVILCCTYVAPEDQAMFPIILNDKSTHWFVA